MQIPKDEEPCICRHVRKEHMDKGEGPIAKAIGYSICKTCLSDLVQEQEGARFGKKMKKEINYYHHEFKLDNLEYIKICKYSEELESNS